MFAPGHSMAASSGGAASESGSERWPGRGKGSSVFSSKRLSSPDLHRCCAPPLCAAHGLGELASQCFLCPLWSLVFTTVRLKILGPCRRDPFPYFNITCRLVAFTRARP